MTERPRHRASNDATESDADDFAAAFLMPGQEVLDDETLEPGMDLASAATAWGVSPRALAGRLRELRRITDLQFRALIHEAKGLPLSEGRRSLLGAPSRLVDVVRSAGGSHAAASNAFLTVEQLRGDYLARAGGRITLSLCPLESGHPAVGKNPRDASGDAAASLHERRVRTARHASAKAEHRPH